MSEKTAMLTEARLVAESGAAMLDEAAASNRCDGLIPADWRTRLNPRVLILDNPSYCVLGQLGAQQGLRFWDMVQALDLNLAPGELTRFGFALDEELVAYGWDHLQQAWDDLLAASRAE